MSEQTEFTVQDLRNNMLEYFKELSDNLDKVKAMLPPVVERISDDAYSLAAETSNEAYNKGLEDAWELARKLFCPPRYKGIDGKTLSVLFETDVHNVPARYTVQEALAKFEAYEKEHTEELAKKEDMSDLCEKIMDISSSHKMKYDEIFAEIKEKLDFESFMAE